MDPARLRVLERRLASGLWLIGGWLRRSAARALAQAAQEGDSNAARALARAVAERADARARAAALAELPRLTHPAAIDALCASWATTRQADLDRLLRERGWLASGPPRLRVLTLLRLGRLDEIGPGNAEVVAPLVAAAEDDDAAIASQARLALGRLTDPAAQEALCQLIGRQALTVSIKAAITADTPEVVPGDWPTDLPPAIAVAVALRCLPRQARARAAFLDTLSAVWVALRAAELAAWLRELAWVATKPPRARVLTACLVGKLAAVAEGDGDLVPALVAATRDADPTIITAATTALHGLTAPAARDAVCRLAIERDDPTARAAALAAGYLPRDGQQRALFLFLTEQWERYETFDLDQHLLRAAYQTAAPDLRRRLGEKVRAAGRTAFLTVMVGADYRARAGAMSDSEASLLVQMLTEHQEWPRLWGLAGELSFAWSVRVVTTLASAGWQPAGEDERATLTELSHLAAGEMATRPDAIVAALPPAVQRATARVSGRVNDLAFAPDRPVLALGTGQRRVVLWDFQRAAPERVVDGFARSIGRVAFTAAATLAWAERTNATDAACGLYLWRDDRPLRLGEHIGPITGLAPVGHDQALTTGRDGQVSLWDLAAGRPIRRRRLDDWARGACVSADGQRAALLHGGIALLSLPSLADHPGTVFGSWSGKARCAAFTPDNAALVVGTFGGETHLCPFDQIGALGASRPLATFGGQVEAIAPLARRGLIIAAAADGQVVFSALASGATIGRLQVGNQRLTSLHVSPDEAFMAIGDSDASFSLWDLRALDGPDLFRRPFAEAAPAHLAAAGALAGDPRLAPPIAQAVRYVQCVLRHRFRYAIEIDAVPIIQAGEFDITVE